MPISKDTPRDLLAFLKLISPERLRRAPGTKRAQYPSPGSNYKPILLLATVNRIHARAPLYRDGMVRYAPSTDDFTVLYEACYGKGSADPVQTKVTQAYWYLGAGSPQIWSLVAPEGRESALAQALQNKEQVKQQKRLLEIVSHATLPPEISTLLLDTTAARAILAFLQQEFFPPSMHESLDRTLRKLRAS